MSWYGLFCPMTAYKDGQRASISSHCTKIKPKYPGYSRCHLAQMSFGVRFGAAAISAVLSSHPHTRPANCEQRHWLWAYWLAHKAIYCDIIPLFIALNNLHRSQPPGGSRDVLASHLGINYIKQIKAVKLPTWGLKPENIFHFCLGKKLQL